MTCRTASPKFGASPTGNRKYWTDERIVCAMYDLENGDGFPRRFDDYEELTAGRPDLPTANTIARYSRTAGPGSWPRAIERAGIERAQTFSGAHATDEEIAYLHQWAGIKSLREIDLALRRPAGWAKAQLMKIGVRARDIQGKFTAHHLARTINVSIHRILDACRDGSLPAEKHNGSWQIEPTDVKANIDWLTAPKKTHKQTPATTHHGYAGITRHVDGRRSRKAVAPEALLRRRKRIREARRKAGLRT